MRLTVFSVAFPLAPVRPDTAGGAEQVLLTLDRELVRAGHRSLVACAEHSRIAGEAFPVAVPRCMIDDALRETVHRELRTVIRDVLDREPVDIVHLHGIDFGDYLPPPGPPVLVTLHLPPEWYDPRALRSGRPATWLVCVSHSQQKRCGDLPGLLPWVENGVDTGAFGGSYGKYGYALCLGRVCREKGYHLALDAARRAGMPLMIAGEVFPYEDHVRYFETEIRPRLDGDRYQFLGPAGSGWKQQLLAGAQCLVVPSLSPETSSLSAMEALASGTPVVAFPAGALADIVEHGRTGFLVSSEAEMADAMEESALIDPEDCRAAALERFSAARMAADYLGLYSRILEMHTGRKPVATDLPADRPVRTGARGETAEAQHGIERREA